MLETISDALVDTAKLLPFLFVTYLAMEWLESRAGERINGVVARAKGSGPAVGALLGLIPSCGFASAAANLYAGGVIGLGTMLAVFWATSDEMVPLLISNKVPAITILSILAIKGAIGIVGGYLVTALDHSGTAGRDIDGLCQREQCHCEEGSIIKAALTHTMHIALFVLIMNLALGAVLALSDMTVLSDLMHRPYIALPLAGLIGLIPNCAASVALTQMWLDGVMGLPAMIAGLTVNAGVGLAVLFRVEPDRRKNVKTAGLLYAGGLAAGLAVAMLGITL